MDLAWRHPVGRLRRLGFQRGVVGGSRAWLLVAVGLWLARATRRALTRTAELAATEVLRPGESITIRALSPEPRARRH